LPPAFALFLLLDLPARKVSIAIKVPEIAKPVSWSSSSKKTAD
jgi:hypothetical protein